MLADEPKPLRVTRFAPMAFLPFGTTLLASASPLCGA
jgi:hypothetical protein